MDARAFEVLGSCWNDLVGTYLSNKFVSAPKDQLFESGACSLSQNTDLCTFGKVPFGIHSLSYTLELFFNSGCEEKMIPVIEAIKEWEDFKRFKNRFMVRTENKVKGSISIIFDSGEHNNAKDYMNRYKSLFPEVTLFD